MATEVNAVLAIAATFAPFMAALLAVIVGFGAVKLVIHVLVDAVYPFRGYPRA